MTVDDEIESCIGKREQISFDWNYPDSERTQSRLRDRDIRRITFGRPGIDRQRSQRFEQLTAAGPTLVRASLAQNSPNPFNPTTQIAYTLALPARAVIEIVDVSGSVVARIDEGMQPAGAHNTIWNGRDDDGTPAASGVYFYRLQGMADVAARKMVLLK